MLSSLVLLSGLAASISGVEAHISQHHKRASPQSLYRRAGGALPADGYKTNHKAPKEWATEQLEPYDQYHFRYLTVKCQNMHNTDFFERCCHPRFAAATDADHPYECSVAAHSDVKAKKLKVEMKAAGAEASDQRHAAVKSIHSVSSASIASIHSKHSAHIASISSASVASVESVKSVKSVKNHPTPTHTEKPKPTHTEKPQPTETEKPTHVKPQHTETPEQTKTADDSQPTQDSGNGGGSGGSGGGQQYGAQFGTPSVATWYLQAGTIGACGLQSSPVSDQSKVAAMRYDFYDSAKCGQNIKVTNTDNGKSVIAMFNDMCMGCETATSIDLSPGAFEEIGDFATGTLNIDWEWVN